MPEANNPSVFLDLLAARLAFERSGTRLYEALLAKLDASEQAAHDGAGRGPTRAELESVRDDEMRHAGILIQAIERLGADPARLTPTRDISLVTCEGALRVVADPRSTLTHALHAVHMAELTDWDCWQTLSDLAEVLGHEDLAIGFQHALGEEQSHLLLVRGWLTTALAEQAGPEPSLTGLETPAL